MARFLALEWNNTEARIAVASTRAARATIEQAFSVPLDAGPEAAPVGQQLAAALAAHDLSRMETLVAVGRAQVELRQMALPPAPDSELPDLVRLQASREFGMLEDNWPLDFMPIDGQADEPRNILAAAMNPEQVSQIRQTCEEAGLKLRRLVLRPCAAASLLYRVHADCAARPHLLLDLLGDEADMTIMADQKVTFLRTARLPGSPLADPEAAKVLLGEIRRTMVSAQNQLNGRLVESIILCGVGAAQAGLVASIQQELATPAEEFDPLAGLELGRALRQAPPEQAGRFAPLLGMLLDELQRVPHAIDFLHPRRRPQPPNRRRQYIAAAATVAVLAVGYFGYSWWDRSHLETEVQRLTQESKDLERVTERAGKIDQAVTDIGKWAAGDVGWLDELYELCSEFPPAQDAMLTQLSMESTDSHGVEMELQGLARSPESIDQLEQRLRDEAHRVEGKGRNLETSQQAYPWRFKSSLLIDPEKRAEKRGEKL